MSFSDAKKWQEISGYFLELVEMSPKDQQATLLKLQKEDAELHAAVSTLLEEEASLHPILFTQAPQSWTLKEDEDLVGTQIGNYLLDAHVGSGGMGSVFRAKRINADFEQEVALKLIKPGNLSEAAIRSFNQERQILAKLSHPGLASLYDGGKTESNRLYFTMEFVEGKDIITFLQNKKADLIERIQYFLKIARAIAHAHARLVLHLDVKPANILVNEEGEVKVLDFGVAEQLDSEAFSVEKGTRIEQKPYTLAYGSPEQLRGKPLSTQSDIYSLGVLLFQMFTDHLPIPYREEDPFTYKKRVLREEILAPSEASSFPHPSLTPGKLRGDLDSIVLTCLSKKSEDRYNSVEQLIADVEAYVEDRPISIRRKERSYSFGKFVKRNQSWLVTLGIALIGLISLVSFYTIELQKERNEALAESRKNRQLKNFMVDVFDEADPYYAKGDTLTVYDLLEQADQRLDTTLNQDALLYAEMVYSIGTVYMGMGEIELADSIVRKGIQMLKDNPEYQETAIHADLLFLLADIEHAMYSLKDAETHLLEGIKIAEVAPPSESFICASYSSLGSLMNEQLLLSKEDSFYTLAIDCVKEMPEPSKELLASLYQNKGMLLQEQGKYAQAKIYLRKAMGIFSEIFDASHPDIAQTNSYLADLYYDMNQMDTALIHAKDAIQGLRLVYGNSHVQTAAAISVLSKIYTEMGLHDSSLIFRQQMLEIVEDYFPYSHPYEISIKGQLTDSYIKLEQLPQAEQLAREAVQLYHKIAQEKGAESVLFQGTHGFRRLSWILYLQDKNPEALGAIQKARALHSQMEEGAERMLKGLIHELEGLLLLRLGKKQAGEVFLKKAREILAESEEKYANNLERIEEALEGL